MSQVIGSLAFSAATVLAIALREDPPRTPVKTNIVARGMIAADDLVQFHSPPPISGP
jgi:hypothetical protein